jgi:hypothetical protein
MAGLFRNAAVGRPLSGQGDVSAITGTTLFKLNLHEGLRHLFEPEVVCAVDWRVPKARPEVRGTCPKKK